jgi:flagellin-like protein
MKNLRKIRKNTKALSPVVASIILIAVTVAVSIAVAAWMGALTVGFMDTNSVTITDASFTETAADAQDTITLAVKNTGTSSVTIASAKVNGATVTVVATGDLTIVDGGAETLTLTADWLAGNAYKTDLYDASGQLVGAYQATAT